MGGVVTKNWVVKTDDKEHIVQLRHNTFSGRRVIFVNGKQIWNSSKFLDDGDAIKVTVGDQDAEILIQVDQFGFAYALEVGGKVIPDQIQIVQNDFKEPDMRVSIPFTEIKESEGEKVVFYVMEIIMENKKYHLPKRFKDFDALNAQIRSAFTGNHLLANLPNLPSKYLKLWYDHSSPEFVDQRRQELEQYMNRLVQVPKVLDNPDFGRFCRGMKEVGDAPARKSTLVVEEPDS